MSISLFENDRIEAVQKKKKYANFTVREIGGPAEILVWRAEQDRKHAMSISQRQVRLDQAKQLMFGADAPKGEEVTWQGSASIASPSQKTWQERFKEGAERRASYMKPEILTELTMPKIEVQKKTVFQRIKHWFGRIWKSANL